MSGHAFTPIRELASAAAQKASDAYAAARATQAMIDGLKSEIASLREDIAEMRRLPDPQPKRKNAR